MNLELTKQKNVRKMTKERFPVKEKAQSYSYSDQSHDSIAILIHGFTGSPYDMKELADFLFDHGIDVRVVRLAGHGTHIEDLIETQYDDWFESVHSVVAEVEKTGKGIFLIGYSFGANIALDLCAREPQKYKGIVCLGPSIYWKSRAYYFILYHLFRAMGVRKVRKPYVPKLRVEAWESTGNYAEFPTSGLGHFRDFVKQHTKKNLQNITTPILIIHSRDDRISHPKSSEYLFENISSAYKELFILPELNHNPLRSENKNKIFDRIVHFIQS